MIVLNFQILVFLILIVILLERFFEIVKTKRIETCKTYNTYSTYLLTLSYLLLNTIIIVELINRKNVNVYLLVTGVLIYFVSTSYRRKAIKTLGMYFRLNIAFTQDHKLITSGIYAIVRHPYYFGAILEVVAIPIIFNSFNGVIFCLVVNIPLWVHRVTIEEKVLVDFFGDAYLQYSRSVPLIFPIKNFAQKISSVLQR